MASNKSKVNYVVGQSAEDEDAQARMQMEQLIQGSLCANCKHQGNCAFLQKTCTPIMECELYECGLSDKPRLMVVNKACTPAEAYSESDDALLGLCINCENLRDCRLPRPVGGVWMCEEYR
jgi:Zn ribbon nucleic-acid-binding protein